MFACLYVPVSPLAPVSQGHAPPPEGGARQRLVDAARTCSPRVQVHADHLVTLDIDGLARLFGSPQAVAEQVRRAAADGGCPLAHVAVAATQTAAILLASMRAGITVVEAGGEAAALAPLPLRALEALTAIGVRDGGRGARDVGKNANKGHPPAPGSTPRAPVLPVLSRWGIRTLGQLAALPAVQLSERLGQAGVQWQRWARGEDLDPLVPSADEEIFEATFEPEWPLEAIEPLSFVLARLLEPLCQRLERRDRAAAVLHLRLRLVTREVDARRLELPAPMRDPSVLRTLLVLALEANPVSAGIDIVTIAIDPTPGRVVQESLLARALPPPEQVATLMARLSALMGERRCGTPALVDSHRPGAFAMGVFRMEDGQKQGARSKEQEGPVVRERARESRVLNPESRTPCVALRRFRLPVPARVTTEQGRPVGVRTDRQNLQGGRVRACAGPWRTSGEWWNAPASSPTDLDVLRGRAGWHRDEWDVTLSDGGVYRIFEDRDSGRWFLEGMLD